MVPVAAVRQDQTVRHAGQTPAGPDLPALRAAVEGPRLHCGAAVLPHRPLDHQGLGRRRHLPHDGEPNAASAFFYFHLNSATHLLSLSAGSGSGVHQEASGFLLHQERAELARRPDSREQEEEGGRQEEEGEGGETLKPNSLGLRFLADTVSVSQDAQRMLEEADDDLPYDRDVIKFPNKNLKGR